jgi:hypothetical protein
MIVLLFSRDKKFDLKLQWQVDKDYSKGRIYGKEGNKKAHPCSLDGLFR